MKRAMFSVIVPVVAFSLALVAFMPAPAAEAQTVACPAGYTCTPITPVTNCPVGYVCTPNNSGGGSSGGGGGVVAPTTDATVTINGTPSLALTYDSQHGEAALTLTGSFTVHGNTQGIEIYQNGAAVQFISSAHSQGSGQVVITPSNSSLASSSVDSYGRNVFVVAPGQTTSFGVSASVNPKQMFAGSYTASLQSVYGDSMPPSTDGSSVFASVPTNQSNAVTIVGEVSPYITSVTPSIVSPGQTLTISGQRLTNSVIFIDNSVLYNVTTGISTDGTSMTFVAPSLTNGYHSIQVKNENTGASNQVSFQVQSAGSTSCYVFSNNLTIGSTGADVVALQTWLMGNGYDIPAVSSGRQQKGVYSYQTAAAVAKYQASVGIPATGFFGPATRAALNKSCAQPQPINPQPIGGAGITASLDPSSPLASTVQISTSAVTQNVPLAVFDVKSQGSPSTLQALTIGVIVNGGNTNISSFFTNLFIKAGGRTYAETSIASDNKSVSFTNFNIPLPADVSVPITILGSVAQDTNHNLNSSNALVELPTSALVALDSNYNNVSAGQSLIVGNTITFSSASSGVQISNTSSTLGSQTCDNAMVSCVQPVTFSFTLIAGNNPIFVSTSVAQNTYSSLHFASGNGNIIPNIVASGAVPSLVPGDNENYWYLPPGSSRQINLSGTLSSSAATVNGANIAQMTAIDYGTSATNLHAYSITSGLDNLKAVVMFNGGASAVCPAGYICSVPGGGSSGCPAGYVCTPVSISNCPTGYTCYSETPTTYSDPGLNSSQCWSE